MLHFTHCIHLNSLSVTAVFLILALLFETVFHLALHQASSFSASSFKKITQSLFVHTLNPILVFIFILHVLLRNWIVRYIQAWYSSYLSLISHLFCPCEKSEKLVK